MATLEGTVGGSDQVMAGQFQDIEMNFVIESSVVEGSVFSF